MFQIDTPILSINYIWWKRFTTKWWKHRLIIWSAKTMSSIRTASNFTRFPFSFPIKQLTGRWFSPDSESSIPIMTKLDEESSELNLYSLHESFSEDWSANRIISTPRESHVCTHKSLQSVNLLPFIDGGLLQIIPEKCSGSSEVYIYFRNGSMSHPQCQGFEFRLTSKREKRFSGHGIVFNWLSVKTIRLSDVRDLGWNVSAPIVCIFFEGKFIFIRFRKLLNANVLTAVPKSLPNGSNHENSTR